jgi:uncharacterized protein with PQ loop repeat
MQLELHHQSLRKNKSAIKANKSAALVKGVDSLAYAISILSLMFTVDQVKIIWLDQRADGVSLLSWTFYTLSAFVWLGYGLIHKDKVITITNFLWVIFSLFIVIGIIIYS